MTPVTCLIHKVVKINVFCLMAGLISFAGSPALAQVEKDPFAPETENVKLTPEEQEAAAQELLKGVQKLVLSQQKRIASKVIRLYPKSESAKVARLLLEEYERFAQIKEEEEKQDAAWMNQVRNHWFVERDPVHDSYFFTIIDGTKIPASKIVNRSKTPVLYEMKGPSMPWNGPYRLRVGESHEFYYSAQIRYFDDQGVVVKHLHQGETLQLNDKNTLHMKQ